MAQVRVRAKNLYGKRLAGRVGEVIEDGGNYIKVRFVGLPALANLADGSFITVLIPSEIEEIKERLNNDMPKI